MLHSQIVQKWGSHFRPPFKHFWGPQKCSKIDSGFIFRGLGGGPKNGPPSRGPKSEILLLFTTLELGPTSQKGTPFWLYFGDLFSQKNEKRGFQKRPKNQSPKTLKMGPKLEGGGLRVWGPFLTSEPCSDPLCCWNAPGPRFFTILASLFLHFCVAARYKEQPFSKKTNTGGSRQELKITSKRTRKMRPILGGGSSYETLSFCSSLGN